MKSRPILDFNPNEYIGQAVIALVYEEGLASQYKDAVPIHLSYGIPATFAIIANRLIHSSYWNRHMNPFQVAKLPELGFEIASHVSLDEETYGEMPAEGYEFDMAESQKYLQGYVDDANVSSLCVPSSSSEGRIADIDGNYYRIARMTGNEFTGVSKRKKKTSSHEVKTTILFNKAKRIIDQAAEKRQCTVLMLQGVVPGAPRLDSEISRDLLEQILKYIAGFNRQTLLPVRLGDIPQLASIKHDSQKPGPVTVSKPDLAPFPSIKQEADSKDGRFARNSDIAAFLSSPREEKITSMILAEDEDFLITYHKNTQDTDTVIISFGGLPSKKTPTGFGSNFALSSGFDHIFVAQREKTQYQGLSLEDFKRAVSPAIKGKKVVTYGSSLGAYCSVYYGGCINAKIISAAPKNSAHPLMLKKAFAGLTFTHKNYAENPRSTRQPVIIYDPYREEEAEFIKTLIKPVYPSAAYVELPFAGHTVLQTMLHSGVLKDFVFGILNRGRVPKVRLRQEDSYIWHGEKGRHYYKIDRLAEAETCLVKSLELSPSEEAVEFLLLIYARMDKSEEASQLLVKGAEWFPENDFVGRLRGRSRAFSKFIDALYTRQRHEHPMIEAT